MATQNENSPLTRNASGQENGTEIEARGLSSAVNGRHTENLNLRKSPAPDVSLLFRLRCAPNLNAYPIVHDLCAVHVDLRLTVFIDRDTNPCTCTCDGHVRHVDSRPLVANAFCGKCIYRNGRSSPDCRPPHSNTEQRGHDRADQCRLQLPSPLPHFRRWQRAPRRLPRRLRGVHLLCPPLYLRFAEES